MSFAAWVRPAIRTLPLSFLARYSCIISSEETGPVTLKVLSSAPTFSGFASFQVVLYSHHGADDSTLPMSSLWVEELLVELRASKGPQAEPMLEVCRFLIACVRIGTSAARGSISAPAGPCRKL